MKDLAGAQVLTGGSRGIGAAFAAATCFRSSVKTATRGRCAAPPGRS